MATLMYNMRELAPWFTELLAETDWRFVLEMKGNLLELREKSICTGCTEEQWNAPVLKEDFFNELCEKGVGWLQAIQLVIIKSFFIGIDNGYLYHQIIPDSEKIPVDRNITFDKALTFLLITGAINGQMFSGVNIRAKYAETFYKSVLGDRYGQPLDLALNSFNRSQVLDLRTFCNLFSVMTIPAAPWETIKRRFAGHRAYYAFTDIINNLSVYNGNTTLRDALCKDFVRFVYFEELIYDTDKTMAANEVLYNAMKSLVVKPEPMKKLLDLMTPEKAKGTSKSPYSRYVAATPYPDPLSLIRAFNLLHLILSKNSRNSIAADRNRIFHIEERIYVNLSFR